MNTLTDRYIMQQVGEIPSPPPEAAIYEESNMNYTTLLDLDAQDSLKISKETVVESDSVNEPSLTLPSVTPSPGALEKRIRLCDILPLRVYNHALYHQQSTRYNCLFVVLLFG